MFDKNKKKKRFQEPVAFMFRKMWCFADDQKGRIILYTVLLITANMIMLTQPLILGWFLNTIQEDGVSAANLVELCLIFALTLLIPLLFWSFHGPGRVLERKAAFVVQKNYKEYLMKNILALKLKWHSDRDSGDTIDKVNKASNHLFYFSQSTFTIWSTIVRMIGSCVALAFFDGFIAICVFLYMTVVFYILYLFDKNLVPQYKKLNSYENDISAKIFDSLSNITSVIILKIQKSVFKDISRSILRPYDLFVRNAILNEQKWFTASVFASVAVTLPVLYYLYDHVQSGVAIQIGTITALILYLKQFSDTFFSFGDRYEDIIRQKASVQNVEDVEESFDHDRTFVGKRKNFKKLDLENVTFSYNNPDENVSHIDNVSLSFKKGEKIALIGFSGSGKTTFLKVLHGLYEDVEGAATIDGVLVNEPIPRINLSTTLVPQEPELFSATIKENITLGTSCSTKHLEEVMKMAAFTDVVKDLPKGLASKIHEKGVNLSGGQKQRLALSRALLFARNKQVILLDESTSSVDPVNEVKIYKNIFRAFRDKTILASIHKMNLLKYFDRIIVFRAGKVIADGTFDELRDTDKTFQKMWREYEQE